MSELGQDQLDIGRDSKITSFPSELLRIPTEAVLVRAGDARDLLGIFGKLNRPFFDPGMFSFGHQLIYEKPNITPEERLVHAWVMPDHFPKEKVPKGLKLAKKEKYGSERMIREAWSYAESSPKRRNTLFFFNPSVLELPFVNDPYSLPPASDVLFAVRLPLKDIRPEHLAGIFPATQEGSRLLRILLSDSIEIPEPTGKTLFA